MSEARQDDGGMAFPGLEYLHGHGCMRRGIDGNLESHQQGMSLRDYFASQAMAFWAGRNIGGWCGDFPQATAEQIARHCYIMADAMLTARKATATQT